MLWVLKRTISMRQFFLPPTTYVKTDGYEYIYNFPREKNCLSKPVKSLAQRTLDSLNEGLPIKMAREKFQRKLYFFHEKDSRFNTRIICKSVFLIGQVPIK